jgi:hypothetical protein
VDKRKPKEEKPFDRFEQAAKRVLTLSADEIVEIKAAEQVERQRVKPKPKRKP